MHSGILSGLLLLSAPTAQFDLAGATIVYRADAPELERFAALELRRYLSQLAGKVIPITGDGRLPDAPAIAVGSAADVIGEAAKVPAELGEEGFVVKVAGRNLILRGREPIGTLYAVYELLEMLGMGFYLGGDTYPEIPAPLKLPADLSRRCKPVFKIRGSLPWYNFLNSPTTWNREDFKAFFDQMAKMKMNFVGFHTYDHEPFGAYRDETGKLVMGAPLKTTLNYDWGMTGPLKTEDFGWGTGRYFDREVFGSHATTDAKNDEDAVLRAQRDLREGLAYARSRGIHVCVGFELTGDPHDAATQRRFRARFANLLSEYPMIDYVWVWQSEGLGGGSEAFAPGTLARTRMEQLRPVFTYLGDEKRIGEASRMTDYVLLAHRVLKQLAPEKPLIVSGWGGDKWMRFSDFYIGFDKVLPKDIIFAALDNIDPSWSPNVSEAYGKLSPDRERWPIPWFESDGGGSRRDQWGPQPNVKPFTHLLRDAVKKGCQGALGIHWRTRGVEEVAAYLAQFAWEPDLSYEAFYDRFAEKCFGAKYAKELGAVLRELESMGSRWSGTCGQVECGGFEWASDGKRPDPNKLARLDQIAERLSFIRRQIVGEGQTGQQETAPTALVYLERLDHLLNTILWLSRYDRAIDRFVPGGHVEKAVLEATQARDQNRPDEAEKKALWAWELVRTSGFGDAIRTYVQLLSSQSEFGVLATVNVKAVVTYRRLVGRIASLLPVGPALEPQFRRIGDAIVVKWRPAAGAAKYRVLTKTTDGRMVPEQITEETCAYLPADFGGQVQIVAISKEGKQGPGSETMMIPGPKDTAPPDIVLCRPSTSFGAGTSIPVRAALVDDGIVEEGNVSYRFPAGGPAGQLPMNVEFRNVRRAEIPVPPAGVGSAPSWAEFWIDAEDDSENTAAAPTGRPVTVSSATIEPRAFARVWPPVSETPPVAGKDWSVVVRVAIDGPEEGVSLVLKVDGGPEIKAEPVPHGSFKAVVPGGAIRNPALKLSAVITRDGQGESSAIKSPIWALRTDAAAPNEPGLLRVSSPRRYQALLEWEPANDDTGVVNYRIERNGKAIAETALTGWLDRSVEPGAAVQYRIVAVDGAGKPSRPAQVDWTAPDWPAPRPPESSHARAGFGLVVLKWKAPEDDVTFRVLRAESQDGPYAVVSGDKPIAATAYTDHPPKAEQAYWWQVVAVDPLGRQGKPSLPVSASAKPVPQGPILVADFDSPETSGKLTGGAKLGPGKKGKGLDLSAGGWADFPDRVEYDDLVEFTIALWIRPETLDPMPVFLSHGFWGKEGIFLQFLGHRVRTYIGNDRVTDGGSPEIGKWQHIAVVRRGDQLNTYIDGRVIATGRFPPTPVGAYRAPLRIGQYVQPSPEYQTRGTIDEVKLYLRPLTDEEIRKDAGT